MRLIMMGTGPFAVPTFESLLASPHNVLALVTRPAVPMPTRGKSKAPATPLRDEAQARGITILAPEEVNSEESRKQLAALRPELFVVCDYGQILSPETLAIPPLGGINLHGSLLPKYRGAAPVNWAIWKGETETGVTILHMTPKLDAGPCLVQVKTEIGPDETAAELEPRLAKLGVAPVHQAMALLARWDRQSTLGVPQDKLQATRAPRLKKSDGLVQWSNSATDIYRQFRALQPWPGLFTLWSAEGQEPLRIILEKITIAPRPPSDFTRAGTVLRSEGHDLIVAASKGAIAIHRLRPAGRRAMDVAEFLRGYKIRPGDVLRG